MTRPVRLLALASLLPLSLLSVDPAWGGEPTEQLKVHVARVFQVLGHLGTLGDAQARRQATRDVSRDLFDLSEMARRTLGGAWHDRSPAEREEFARLLGALVDGQIAGLEPYAGAEIEYVDETVDGDGALVRTRVTTRSGRDLALDYRLVRRGDRWRVWDVLVDHASLAGYYRAQFQKIIRTASYEKLVEKLARP